MNQLRNITVGVDFTAGSREAFDEAVRIARWNRATVHAVHVIDTLVAVELEEALSPLQRGIRDSLLGDARRELEGYRAQADGVNLNVEARIDARVSGLLAAAKQAGAGLLVLGARGERGDQVGVGTVASACVRHAACPVLLVRQGHAGPFRRVVACVDFSDTSLGALDQAARLATQDSAALYVLHVFDAPWHHLHYRSPTPEADAEFQAQYRHAVERRLQGFASGLGREIDYLKPLYDVFDDRGHRSGIVEYAAKVGADLVVLGTRGRTPVRDLLLGTTAERVLRESTCSVLAYRPGQA
jgi:universal stress protein E